MNRWLAGHVFYPLTERVLGRDSLARLPALLASQAWPPSRLRAFQQQRLRGVLQSAARHCPFHAERFGQVGLDPSDPYLTLDDLRSLPTLSRKDIHEHRDAMTWYDCPGGARPYTTGGSTGEPLRFFIDRFRAANDTAARWRARQWWNVQPGDPEVLIWGRPQQTNWAERIRQTRDGLLNQFILNAFDMTEATMDRYIDVLHHRRPACIYGYASSIALLARHARDRGLAPGKLGSDRLQAIFVTGEILLDADRDVIARMFAAPVAIEYGSRDGGFTATTCPHGRLHLADENVIVELLDPQGEPVPDGEVGEIVLTRLDALAMPLIRYRVGDLARRSAVADQNSDQPACPCGRGLSVLAHVQGRATDQIVCRTGQSLRRMHALALIYVLREAPGVDQFRVIQPDLEHLNVEIVATERFTPHAEATVREGLQQRMGTDVTIQLRRCERIAPLASGKHAYVVSQVEPDALASATVTPGSPPAQATATPSHAGATSS